LGFGTSLGGRGGVAEQFGGVEEAEGTRWIGGRISREKRRETRQGKRLL
jgi:hypothetical protein